MTKYKWDMQKIRQLKQECITNPQILNDKYLFNSQQEFCDILMKFYSINKPYNFIQTEDDEEIINIDDFKINVEALNIIENLNKELNNIKEKNNPYYNERIFLNNDQLIELVREMVYLIPSNDLKKSFDTFFNPKNHLINIDYKRFPIELHGITKTDYVNKICYAGILRENSLNDIITILHEFFHMWIRDNEEYNFFKTKKVIYGEVEGCFANILVNQLSNQLGIDKDLFLYSIYDEFNYTVSCLDSLHNYTYTLKTKKEKICSNDFVWQVTNDSMSYLIALDLYYLYQTDPEKALFILLNIPNLTGENIKKELENNNITFYQDNYKNLKRLYKTL